MFREIYKSLEVLSYTYINHAVIMHHAVIINYAWYTPSGQFVAWSTLVNAEFVSGDDTNPANGTLNLLGYTGGGPGVPPSGTLVYKLYSHP